MDEHTPLKKNKPTKRPASFIKPRIIRKLKAERNQLRQKGFYSQNDNYMHNNRQKRSLLKKSTSLKNLNFTRRCYVQIKLTIYAN